MVHECLGLKANRVTLPGAEGDASTAVVAPVYDLDSGHDAFWRENRGANWGLIGPAVKRFRESWQSESEAVRKLQVNPEKKEEKKKTPFF